MDTEITPNENKAMSFVFVVKAISLKQLIVHKHIRHNAIGVSEVEVVKHIQPNNMRFPKLISGSLRPNCPHMPTKKRDFTI